MSKINIIIEDKNFQSQVEYTFKTLFSILGFTDYAFSKEKAEATIYFGKNITTLQGPYLHIESADLLWKNYGKSESIPKNITWLRQEIPCIYAKNGESSPSVEIKNNYIKTTFDLIASAFFMLSRYEERYQSVKLDEHDRFPAKASLAYKAGFLDKPVVNMYAELLKEWLEKIFPGSINWKQNFWAGKDFAFCMTHDVDNIASKPWWATIKDDIKNILKLKPIGFIEGIIHNLQYLTGHNPGNTYSFMMKTEEQHRIPATYFFKTEKRSEEFDDNEYTINSPSALELINKLTQKGHEIGLHTSYHAQEKPEYIQEEAALLRQAINKKDIGLRQHYLRLNVANSFKYFSQAKLIYDSSLSYAAFTGFRTGTCHPFQIYDLDKNEILPIWEIPLVWMEGSLLNYQKLPPAETFKNFEKILKTVAKYKGVMVALFHNSKFSHYELRKLFSLCLEEVNKYNCLKITMQRSLQLFRNQLH